MKRHLRTIAIFLLLGAVVNVAVAWGAALVDPFVVKPEVRGALGTETVWVWTRVGVKHIFFRSMGSGSSVRGEPDFPTDIMPSWLVFEGPTPEHKARKQMREIRTIDGRGWPAISMWCEHERWYWGPGPEETIPLQGGIETGLPDWERFRLSSLQLKRVLPLRPTWPGFAINTLFYAMVLWSLIRGPFALRRFLRLRRGLCPKCAYPMGESSVCTECGGSLPKRASTT